MLAIASVSIVLLLTFVWRHRHDIGEPLGRYIWVAATGYLGGCALGLVSWMDAHSGATAGILGFIGVCVQAWSAWRKSRMVGQNE